MRLKFLLLVAVVFFAAACNKQGEQTTQTPPPTPPALTPTSPGPLPIPTTVNPPTPVTATPTPTPKPTPKPTPTPPAPVPQPTPTPPTSPPPAASERNFTVIADDSMATPSMIMVNRGDKVNLTITLKTTNVYQFGLEFRGGDVNSGTIMPGGSKTISFNAVNSYTLQSYWPSSGVAKAAKIMVHVID